MQEYGTHWDHPTLGQGLRFDLVRPNRGGIMYWCFMPYNQPNKYHFMGEIPEGQGAVERQFLEPGESRKGKHLY
jgi:hypothetical protein